MSAIELVLAIQNTLALIAVNAALRLAHRSLGS